MSGFKNKIILLLFGIGACATMYYNGMNDSISKIIAMACFGILFLLAIANWHSVQPKCKIFRSWLKWFLLACAINALYGIDPTNQDIALPLMVAFSAYTLLNIPREKLGLYFLPVCAFSAFCALYSVLRGLGSFGITSFDDSEIIKNQIGAAFTTVAILSAVLAFDKNSKWLVVVYAVLSILNMYPAIFFSCRTALLCYILVVGYIMYGTFKAKIVVALPLLLIAVYYMGGSSLQSLLEESFVGNKDVNDFDNLTSGRFTHAAIAFDYFLQHPFVGYYGSGDPNLTARAHVYLLRRLSEWGLIGCIPFFALYFSIFKIFIRSLKSKLLLLAALLMLAMIESFGEYAPPFGPGSCFMILFIIMGYCLRLEPLLSNSK